MISNFRRVLNVVWFLLGNSPASQVYIPTFRNTLSVRIDMKKKILFLRTTIRTPVRSNKNRDL